MLISWNLTCKNHGWNKVIGFEDRNCLDYYGHKLKYNELLNLIDDCAKGLYEYGVRKGDVVTLCLPNTLEGVVSFFAINKIGAVVNFIHPVSSENEIKASINEMDSKIIIAIDDNYWKIETIIADTKIKKTILVSLTDYMSFINKLRYHKNKVRLTLTNNNDKYIIWHDFINQSKDLYIKDYTSKDKKKSKKSIEELINSLEQAKAIHEDLEELEAAKAGITGTSEEKIAKLSEIARQETELMKRISIHLPVTDMVTRAEKNLMCLLQIFLVQKVQLSVQVLWQVVHILLQFAFMVFFVQMTQCSVFQAHLMTHFIRQSVLMAKIWVRVHLLISVCIMLRLI